MCLQIKILKLFIKIYTNKCKKLLAKQKINDSYVQNSKLQKLRECLLNRVHKLFYSIILKEPIKAVRPTRSSVYVPPQVSISKVLTAKIKCNIAQYKLNLHRTSTKQLQLIFSEAPCKI